MMQFHKFVTGLMLAIAATATTQSAAFSAQPFQNSTHPTLEEVATQTSSAPSASEVQTASDSSRFDDSSLTSDEVAAIQPSGVANVTLNVTVLPSTQFKNSTHPVLSEINSLN
jgi:hypothetical protein